MGNSTIVFANFERKTKSAPEEALACVRSVSMVSQRKPAAVLAVIPLVAAGMQ